MGGWIEKARVRREAESVLRAVAGRVDDKGSEQQRR